MQYTKKVEQKGQIVQTTIFNYISFNITVKMKTEINNFASFAYLCNANHLQVVYLELTVVSMMSW